MRGPGFVLEYRVSDTRPLGHQMPFWGLDALSFRRNRLQPAPAKKTALNRSKSRDQEPKTENRELDYSFSVFPSYFTLPFLSFWRVTSSLV